MVQENNHIKRSRVNGGGADAAPARPVASERKLLSTMEEVRKAAKEIAAVAKRTISIYTHDLEPGIYDDPDFLEAVKKLVLSRPFARVRVLIADPMRAIKNGNRFVQLGRRLNSYIEFRHVHDDYLEDRTEAYCIADQHGILFRQRADRWDGLADVHAPHVAKFYLTTFDEIWHASELEQEFRRLNL